MFQLYTMAGLKDYILDVLFPRLCLGCKILLSGKNNSYICPTCLASIKIKGGFACAFCSSPVIAGATCPFCKSGHYLDQLWVTTSYENPLVEKILKTMKYRFIKTLADDVARIMAKYLERRFLPGLDIDRDPAIVAPVPLHRRRLNWRGFNQAEIISRKIAEFFGWPLVADALRRVRDAKPQAEMPDRQSRITNVKNIFEFNSLKYGNPTSVVRGKMVLLIDDVATTGSTLDDCARALKGAGAREVVGFVFAKGNPAADKKLLQ